MKKKAHAAKAELPAGFEILNRPGVRANEPISGILVPFDYANQTNIQFTIDATGEISCEGRVHHGALFNDGITLIKLQDFFIGNVTVTQAELYGIVCTDGLSFLQALQAIVMEKWAALTAANPPDTGE